MTTQQWISFIILLIFILWIIFKPKKIKGIQDFRITHINADDVISRVFKDQEVSRVKELFEEYAFKFTQDGCFSLNPSTEHVVTIVKNVFGQEKFMEVMSTLDNYGQERYEAGRNRVQLSIIKASDGDSDKIKGLVSRAKHDFRDIVSLAETPLIFEALASGNYDLGSILSAEHLPERDQELRQYVAWLLRYTH